MANLLTDVTPVLLQAFPNGKPEMSASDFDRALSFVKGRRNGSVPKPGPFSMDYAWWAHTMVVEWRMLVEEWEKQKKVGIVGPEPKFLLCPECGVMMMLDMSSGDVLLCPGGCHRAIRVNTFVELFKRPASNPGMNQRQRTPLPTYNTTTSSGKVALNQTVPKGAKPEDFGITEGVQRSKNALVGWRMWNVYPSDDDREFGLYSLSIATDKPWLKMEPMPGTCKGADPSQIHDHRCPSWEHRCGIHAVKTIKQLRKWGTPAVGETSQYVRVIGQVEMWGRVLEYEEGFRAEWGYPIKLYLPSKIPNRFGMTSEQLGEQIWSAYLTEVVVEDEIFAIP